MMVIVKTIWKCITSPRLYKIYNDGPLEAMYQPHGAEKWGDKIISTANALFTITLYTSPFICFYISKRGQITLEEYKSLVKYIGGVSCFLVFAFLMRAFGRATNPKYLNFMKTLERRPDQTLEEYLAGVRRYDFEFCAWPPSFVMPRETDSSWFIQNPFATQTNADLPVYQRAPIQLLGYLATRTFALRLIYPGSLSLIQSFLWMPIFQGRSSLVQNHNGQRAKLVTPEGNCIDTMFVNNRHVGKSGEILVICCEGNSGFYELGLMGAPVRTGYSALGWNHPGFAESTGVPYPSQEHNAINTLMEYAIDKLNFEPQNIVMYGWSIGGYSAVWAAVHNPVRGVILDATFDDLLPLAQRQMPESWSRLVKEVVRSYVNLHVAELLKEYSGPLQLIRRTDDEIICLRPGHPSSNRGNYLLFEIIKQRHPELLDSRREEVIRFANMLDCKRPSADTLASRDDELALRYVTKYMHDYKSTHCAPLPDDFFASIISQLLSKKID